ncbi:MAG TPA: DUF459 domain-containing protein [Acidimicrobiales bacterium]|jgi:hypothetical protein
MAITAPPRRPYPPRPAPGIDGAPVPGPVGATSRRRSRQPDLPSGDRPMAAGHVLVAILVALLLGALLNADSLWAKAQQQPYGWRRTVAVSAMRPVHAIADVTRLDRGRAWLEDALGREPSGPTGPPPEVHTDTTLPAESAAPVTTVPPPPPKVRQATAAEPLRVWVGGDSMAQVFGESFLRLAEERGDVEATHDYRISTGLTRPDFFDWPAHLTNDVLTQDYEVIVIMFGANDAQPLNIDGVIRESSEPEWQAEYRRRVAATMDLLEGDGRFVVWVGQPIMRSSSFSERIARLNTIYREEAAGRPWVHFFDSWPLFTDAGGGYSDYLPGPDGEPELMRQQDGIHLSRPGGDRLADAILQVIDEEAAGGAPGTTTTTAPGSTAPTSTTAPPSG